jgi:hypothetical protein
MGSGGHQSLETDLIAHRLPIFICGAVGSLRTPPMTTLSALSPDLLTNEEAAALLGIKPNTLEIWRTKGKGPEFVKLGHTKSAPIRYLRAKIFEWLERQSFSSTSAYAPNAKQAV